MKQNDTKKAPERGPSSCLRCFTITICFYSQLPSRTKVTVDQMKPRHGSGINPAIRGILRQDAAGTIGLQENLSYLPEKPDRQDHYIIARQGCQDKRRKNGKKKRRDLHPHPCPDQGPLFFRLAQAGCLSYSFLPDTTPAPLEGGYYENTTRSSSSIAYLRHAVKYLFFYSAQRFPRVHTHDAVCL